MATMKVERGDTLYRIAQQHGTTVDALCKANKIEDPSKLKVGTTLTIPDSFTKAGQPAAAPAADPHASAVAIREARRKDAPGATAARFDEDGKEVFATIGGKEVKIGESSLWYQEVPNMPKILGDGRYVVWPSKVGGFGYENEGQTLEVYDTKTGKVSTLMKEYFYVNDVDCQKLSDGRTAFLVHMSDGGLGASHLAVIDASRGEVLSVTQASVHSVKGDKLVVAHHADEENLEKVTSKETLDLKEVLNRKVIVNKPDWGGEEILNAEGS